MIDRYGGGTLGGLSSLDTRGKLCTDAGWQVMQKMMDQ